MKNDPAIEKQLSDYALNNSRSMISVINSNYIYEKVNARFCNTHSVQCTSVEGKSLRDIWGEENFMTNIKPRVDRCLDGEIVHYEADFEVPAGGFRYYDVVLRPLYSGEGKVTHLLAETFDITELKETEQAFRQIETQFKNLETNLPVGFVRCNMDGEILHINKACRAILDISDDQPAKGLNLIDFYAEKALFTIHKERLLSSPTQSLGRVQLESSVGKVINCRLTGFFDPGLTGFDACIDMAMEDITREVYLESRLLQAQRLESIGALAGGIAHDFNNILTTIYGYAEMSLDEVSNCSTLHSNIGRIITAVSKARSLTNQILTFSRQIEQERVAVNVWSVINETVSFIRSGIPENISFVDDTNDLGIYVLADPTQLFRVFLNLLTNAIQAMHEDGGELVIRMVLSEGTEPRCKSGEKGEVIISISDTGSGMDNSVMERIFEPFFTTREIGKGTGLGLSVVHGIISELEGEIEVESKREVGTSFFIYLPVVGSEQPGISDNGKGTEIFVISGNQYESKMICLGLESSGYMIHYASSTEQLHELFDTKEAEPALIVFIDDIQGFQPVDLANIFKSNKVRIPVLLITASQSMILEESFLNSNIVKHLLLKPVSLRDVMHAIETILTEQNRH